MNQINVITVRIIKLAMYVCERIRTNYSAYIFNSERMRAYKKLKTKRRARVRFREFGLSKFNWCEFMRKVKILNI